MARICIVGEWHQAVVVAACLADLGHEVRGAVSSDAAAARLNAGTPPVHEPELPELLGRSLASGQLRYTASLSDALRSAEFVFIALDTPVDAEDAPDLGPVIEAAEAVGRASTEEFVLVVTAQVPVGTSERLRDVVASCSGRQPGLAYVPEFLRLGHAVRTFMQADRFIIGCDNHALATRLEDIYAPLGRPVVRMSVRSAEMAKHACNAFLAASISFANEIADLCDAVGADIDDVTRGMRLDPRIGAGAFLSAGLGFAGGTLGRDLRALQAIGRAADLNTRLVDATLGINATRPGLVLRQLERIYGNVAGLRIGILGLTYKPGTSTMRRSAALDIIRELTRQGADVHAYDPLADLTELESPPPFTRVADPYAAAELADALVLVTEWQGMDELRLDALRSLMRRPVFVDTRNHFKPARMAQHGLIYIGVGRGSAAAERARSQETDPAGALA